MKKLVFLLSITAILSACSSDSPEPADPNALPNGIMQPVDGTGAMEGGGFMPEVQQSSMPANMK